MSQHQQQGARIKSLWGLDPDGTPVQYSTPRARQLAEADDARRAAADRANAERGGTR